MNRLKMLTGRHAMVLLAACALVFAAGAGQGAWGAADISVRALVERVTVTLGEPFLLQIQVEGQDVSPATQPPDMSALHDFSVESLGSRSNSSSSITIVNGRMSKVETHGYVLSFQLTPKKTGRITIPSLSVPVDGKTYPTQPILLQVEPPETTEDFHLKVSFSKTRFYVGEPVRMTVTWYLARDVKDFAFHLPILEVPGLVFSDPQVDQGNGKQYYQVPLGQGTAIGEKGRESTNGREYMTLSFTKVVSASQPGTLEVPPSSVSCKALTGIARDPRRRSGNPMDDFMNDDFFRPGRREIFKTFVARSEPLSLTVLPLPAEGRPKDFSGAVGRFHMEVAAHPTQVNVGDPITLTVSIKGSGNLESIQPASLFHNDTLEKEFKVPEEMAAGVVKDGVKTFTQTLRAKSDSVTAIPPLRFATFDPEQGKYQVAQSPPIPLQVKPTRVVTASDAEGRMPAPAARNELEAWSQGIAHNYEGPDLLVNQKFGVSTVLRSPLWLAALTLPFSLYVVLFLAMRRHRERVADPDRFRARRALQAFKRNMKGVQDDTSSAGGEAYARILQAVRQYLGDKLKKEGAALTFQDVRGLLAARGVDEAVLHRLEQLFARCEQGRYGGGASGPSSASGESLEDLEREAMQIIEALERKISI
ncbi:BatD family protein [Desulforhabdus sp. TSK]|uniref:BatD family protein n=1 Tax=Desulforhabdus sp. TSK TaxID=2925014 RepID=UPI001FC83158|nr:BatD family protein [Desulforhabdus sp. TSK]GKT09240.1 hypothetical protein DSTSK_25450 [Desulforhabdus sp. TSK]